MGPDYLGVYSGSYLAYKVVSVNCVLIIIDIWMAILFKLVKKIFFYETCSHIFGIIRKVARLNYK